MCPFSFRINQMSASLWKSTEMYHVKTVTQDDIYAQGPLAVILKAYIKIFEEKIKKVYFRMKLD